MGQEKSAGSEKKPRLIFEFRLQNGNKAMIKRGKTESVSRMSRRELRYLVYEAEDFSEGKPSYLVKVRNQDDQEKQEHFRIDRMDIKKVSYLGFFALIVHLDASGKLEKTFMEQDLLRIGKAFLFPEFDLLTENTDFPAKLRQYVNAQSPGEPSLEVVSLLKLYQCCLKFYLENKEDKKGRNASGRKELKEELKEISELLKQKDGMSEQTVVKEDAKQKLSEFEKKKLEGGSRYMWNRAMEQYGFVRD